MGDRLNLKEAKNWSGVWTALITPLNPDLSLDSDSLERLMNEQIAAGVTGLVIAGSTGEGSSLPPATFQKLLEESIRIAKGRIPLIAGLGIGSTVNATQCGKLAKDAGFQGLLASPPAYIKAPQRGLKLHFETLAKLGLPICLYEIPGRAASSLQVATLADLTKNNPLFTSTKDATGDMGRMIDCQNQVKTPLAYLSGDDLSYHGFLCHGGNGVISVVSHFLPKTLVRMTKLVAEKKIEESLKLQTRIQKFTESLFSESNPIPTKSLMKKLGKIRSDTFVPPLVPMDEALLSKCFEMLKSLNADGIE